MDLDKKLLKAVLSVQTKHQDDQDMLEFITKRFMYLQTRQKEVEWEAHYDDYGNLYITKGQAPEGGFYPSVVCHIDTVHKREKHFVVQEFSGYKDGSTVYYAMNMINVEQVGIGGDDKVGVYICLHLLDALPAVKAVFYKDEEVGCRGSRAGDMTYFADCAFVLQADRRGKHDFIRTGSGVKMYSRKFERAIRPYLRKYDFQPCDEGAGSDTPTLKSRGLPICAANVSCGYFNPHGPREFIVSTDVERTLSLFADICLNLSARRWPHVYKPEPKYFGYWDKELKKYFRPGDAGFNKKKALMYEAEREREWGKGWGSYGYGEHNSYTPSNKGSGTGYGYGNKGYGHSGSGEGGSYTNHNGNGGSTTVYTGSGSKVENNSSGETRGTGANTAGAQSTSDEKASSSASGTTTGETGKTIETERKTIYHEDGSKTVLYLPRGESNSTALAKIEQLPLALAPAKEIPAGGTVTGDGTTGGGATNTKELDEVAGRLAVQGSLLLKGMKEMLTHCEICLLDNIIHLPRRYGYYCENCDAFIPYPTELFVRRPPVAANIAHDLAAMEDGEVMDLISEVVNSPDFVPSRWTDKYGSYEDRYDDMA